MKHSNKIPADLIEKTRSINTDLSPQVSQLKEKLPQILDKEMITAIEKIISSEAHLPLSLIYATSLYNDFSEKKKALDHLAKLIISYPSNASIQNIYSFYHPRTAHYHQETTDYLKKSFCKMPFERLEMDYHGNAYLCCPIHLHQPIGNIFEQPWEELWNSPTAKQIRQSIIDGSFRFCNRTYCPYINTRSLTPANEIKEPSCHVPHPKKLLLGWDHSCNLACPSCRTRYNSKTSDSLKSKIQNAIKRSVIPLLPHINEISPCSAGDPIHSSSTNLIWDALKTIPSDDLTIRLQTNGQLFTEDWWRKHKHLQNFKMNIRISIDACSKKTYEQIRKGGSYKKLITNLQFLSTLRSSGIIKELSSDFVVQKLNYKQMIPFIKLSQKYGIDSVSYLRINNWGSYTEDEFKEVDIADTNHLDHQDLRLILTSPIFNAPPISLSLGALFAIKPKRRFKSKKTLYRLFSYLPHPIQRHVFKFLYV